MMLASVPAYADTSDIKASNNQIGLQYLSTDVNYSEYSSGTGLLDTEKGNVPGYSISTSLMKDVWLGNDYFEAQYNHNSGNTNYVGSPLLGSGAYGSVIGQSSAALIDYSARYGVGMELGSQFMATPYLELGHHEWDRGVNYGENYTNNYYGIGVLGQYSPADKLVLTGNVMVGNTFNSNIVVNSGPAIGGFSGALGNSTIYRYGVAADYAFTINVHANIGIDYTSFKYGMSAVYPVSGGIYEPASKTSYTTARIGIGYAF